MKAVLAKAKADPLIFPTTPEEGDDGEDIFVRLARPETPPNVTSEANKRMIKKQDQWEEANKAGLAAILEILPLRQLCLLCRPLGPPERKSL